MITNTVRTVAVGMNIRLTNNPVSPFSPKLRSVSYAIRIMMAAGSVAASNPGK